MAKIPVIDGPDVTARGYSNPGPMLENSNPGAEVSRGMGQLGGAAEYLGKQIEARDKAAREKAYAISQANADAAYQNEETRRLMGGSNRRQLIDDAFNEEPGSENVDAGDVEHKPGFNATRGMDAAKQSGAVLDEMDAARQRIAKESFADEEQRQRWLARSEGMLADTNRKVTGHVAQQFRVAQEDALKGKLASTLQAIASDTDGSQTARLMASAEESIRSLQSSKEGGDAAIQKLQQEALKVRIDRLLTDGRVDVAEKQYEIAKGTLGTEVPEVARAIARAKDVKKVDTTRIAAADSAKAAFDAAVNPKTGWVDPVKARTEIEKLPSGPVKDAANDYLESRLRLAEQQKKAAIDTHFNSALEAYRAKGSLAAVSAVDEQFLKNKDNDPEAWEKLRRIARSDADYWQRLRENKPGETEEQRLALIAFKADLNERPDYYSGLTPEQFASEPLVQGLSPPGFSQAGGLYAATKKEDPIRASEFGKYVDDAIADSPGLSKDKNHKARFRARMGDLRREHLAANGNKEPTFEQVQAMEAAATQEIVTDKGFFYDTKKPAYLAPFDNNAPRPLATKPLGPAAPPATPKKLAPGRYKDRAGKVWVVDAQGNKRAE